MTKKVFKKCLRHLDKKETHIACIILYNKNYLADVDMIYATEDLLKIRYFVVERRPNKPSSTYQSVLYILRKDIRSIRMYNLETDTKIRTRSKLI